jgi:hypothetical protein
MPHSYCPVARPCEDVEIVRVEANAVNVIVVTDVDTERLDVVGGP